MKGKGGVIANVLVLISGIILILLHKREGVLPGVIVIMGVTFVVPSVLNVVMLLLRRVGNRGRMWRLSVVAGMVASLGGIALGLWMILFPDTLVGLLVYLFAALLVIGGSYHLYMMLFGFRPLRFPLWMYVLPTLFVIGGAVLLGTDISTIESYIVLIAGIAMTVFACWSFVAMIASRRLEGPAVVKLPENESL